MHPVEVNYPCSVYIRIRFTAIRVQQSNLMRPNQMPKPWWVLNPWSSARWVGLNQNCVSVTEKIPLPSLSTFHLQFIETALYYTENHGEMMMAGLCQSLKSKALFRYTFGQIKYVRNDGVE